ncbi:hypothetical protein [Streptomyces sp. NBC_00691]|uniref:hypothetical protein n=1 Tax=Streptomyces sp. NBC_00691 TaxID=2903671 RepID=UPI002E32E062|nr:hypothetical protein [Streptomyces sp. NBC_00691]
MVRTRLKLAATLTVVVLALTGFHTGHGSSSGGGSGKSKSGKSKSRGHSDDDSGGGCSSDEKSNDDYSGSGGNSAADEYTYDPTPTATPTADVRVSTVDCVKPAQKKRKGKPARKADTTTTLRITSDAWEEKTYRVVVEFRGAAYKVVDKAETTITVERRGTKTFEVGMAHPGTVGQVKECVAFVEGEAPGATPSTATPSPTSS